MMISQFILPIASYDDVLVSIIVFFLTLYTSLSFFIPNEYFGTFSKALKILLSIATMLVLIILMYCLEKYAWVLYRGLGGNKRVEGFHQERLIKQPESQKHTLKSGNTVPYLMSLLFFEAALCLETKNNPALQTFFFIMTGVTFQCSSCCKRFEKDFSSSIFPLTKVKQKKLFSRDSLIYLYSIIMYQSISYMKYLRFVSLKNPLAFLFFIATIMIPIVYPIIFRNFFRFYSILTQNQLTDVEYILLCHCTCFLCLLIIVASFIWLVTLVSLFIMPHFKKEELLLLLRSTNLQLGALTFEYTFILVLMLLILSLFLVKKKEIKNSFLHFYFQILTFLIMLGFCILYLIWGRSLLIQNASNPLNFFMDQVQQSIGFSRIQPPVFLMRRYHVFFLWIIEAMLVIQGSVLLQKTSTNKQGRLFVRKLYHWASFIAFIPIVLFEDVLFLSFILTLSLFFFLYVDILRAQMMASQEKNMPLTWNTFPFHVVYKLNEFLSLFKDWRDKRILTLTPFYLLLGVAFPIIFETFLYLSSSKPFNFMASCSGLIAIGVADSFSALVGSVYGKHVILKGYKTYEGLSAFFFSYATMAISLAYILHLLNILKSFNFILTLKILFTSMFTAAFESYTYEVDNFLVSLFALTTYRFYEFIFQ